MSSSPTLQTKKSFNYLASSVLNRILRYDWLLERARWRCVARSGLRAVFRKPIVFSFHKIEPFSTKLIRSRWLDIGLGLFLCFCVSLHKHTKIELGQYPPMLTSRLENNPYISYVDRFQSNRFRFRFCHF